MMKSVESSKTKGRSQVGEDSQALLLSSTDYRLILNTRIKELKISKPGFGIVRLCEKLGLHSSYISAALKGQKPLSTDQLFLLAEALGFHESAVEQLLLLLNYERAQAPKLKSKILKQILEAQKQGRKSESHLSAKLPLSEDLNLARYYSNPIYKLLHVFLGIEKYRLNRNELSRALNISEEVLEEHLKVLKELGVVVLGPNIQVIKKNYHLPKDFFICKPHQAMMKHLSLQKQMTLSEDKKETVCVTFSASDEDYVKIHQEFLLFLKRAESIVKDSPAQNVFQMIFDLHHWS